MLHVISARFKLLRIESAKENMRKTEQIEFNFDLELIFHHNFAKARNVEAINMRVIE
jgi:hypothetical protein